MSRHDSIGSMAVMLGANLQELQQGFGNAIAATQAWGQQTATQLKRIGSQFEEAGRRMSLSVTAPLAGLAYAAVRAADKTGEVGKQVEQVSKRSKLALEPLGRALITAFESARPTIQGVVNVLGAAVDEFAKLSPQTQRLIILSAAAAAAIGPMSLAMGSVVRTASAAALGIKGLATATASLVGFLPALIVGLTALGAAAAAFEFGRYLHDEFKIVQVAGAHMVSFLNRVWIDLKYNALIAFEGIRVAFEALFRALQVTAGTLMRVFGRGIQDLGKAVGALDSDVGRTISDVGGRLRTMGEELREAIDAADKAKIDPAALEPLAKQIQMIMQLRDRIGAEGQRALNLSVIDFFSEIQGGTLDAAKIHQAAGKIADALEASGEEGLKIAGQQLRRRRDEIFDEIASSLPAGMRFGLLMRRWQEEIERDAAIKATSLASISQEFGGRVSRGRSFLQFLQEDEGGIAGVIQSMTERIRAFLTSVRDWGAAATITLGAMNVAAADGAEFMQDVVEKWKETGEAAAKLRLELLPEEWMADQIAKLKELRLWHPDIVDDEVFRLAEERIRRRFAELTREADKTFGDKMGDAVEGFGRRVSDTFADLVVDGKASFDELGRSFQKMLWSMTMQELAVGPIFKILGQVAGTALGAGGTEPTTPHGGFGAEVYGPPRPTAVGGFVPDRAAHEAMFGAAPALPAGGGLVVNIHNSTGGEATVRASESTGPGGERQLEIWIEKTVQGMFAAGKMDRTMSASYGLSRRGGPR